jgi:hypothetical protein
MPPLDLLNLIPFYQRLPEQAASGHVGPFQVELSPSYNAAVRLVEHPEEAEGETPFPYFRIITGCWAATAQANLVVSSGDESVLCTTPAADGGTNDLLELLTFLTGRRVALRETMEQHHPSSRGDAPVHPMALFPAAAEAWPNRTALVEHNLQNAIIFHNCATDYDAIPVMAGMYNTALNILIDNWPGIGAGSIPSQVRNSLADLVGQAVEVTPDLDDAQRNAYKGLLRAKVMQGTDSMYGRLLRLLQALDIVEDPCDTNAERRVRYINTARNSITHRGTMPQFKGMDTQRSNLLTVTIIACMVREINQIALGWILGIDQHILVGRELQDFFSQGVWAGTHFELTEVSSEEEPP